jgi:hypothetical protein
MLRRLARALFETKERESMDTRKRDDMSSGSKVRGKWSALVLAASCLLLAAASASAQYTFPGTVPNTFRLYAGGMYA